MIEESVFEKNSKLGKFMIKISLLTNNPNENKNKNVKLPETFEELLLKTSDSFKIDLENLKKDYHFYYYDFESNDDNITVEDSQSYNFLIDELATYIKADFKFKLFLKKKELNVTESIKLIADKSMLGGEDFKDGPDNGLQLINSNANILNTSNRFKENNRYNNELGKSKNNANEDEVSRYSVADITGPNNVANSQEKQADINYYEPLNKEISFRPAKQDDKQDVNDDFDQEEKKMQEKLRIEIDDELKKLKEEQKRLLAENIKKNMRKKKLEVEDNGKKITYEIENIESFNFSKQKPEKVKVINIGKSNENYLGVGDLEKLLLSEISEIIEQKTETFKLNLKKELLDNISENVQYYGRKLESVTNKKNKLANNNVLAPQIEEKNTDLSYKLINNYNNLNNQIINNSYNHNVKIEELRNIIDNSDNKFIFSNYDNIRNNNLPSFVNDVRNVDLGVIFSANKPLFLPTNFKEANLTFELINISNKILNFENYDLTQNSVINDSQVNNNFILDLDYQIPNNLLIEQGNLIKVSISIKNNVTFILLSSIRIYLVLKSKSSQDISHPLILSPICVDYNCHKFDNIQKTINEFCSEKNPKKENIIEKYLELNEDEEKTLDFFLNN